MSERICEPKFYLAVNSISQVKRIQPQFVIINN